MKISFPFIAQPHQTLHSLPIALEMASRHKGIEVRVACATKSHLDYVQKLSAFYPEANVYFDLLAIPKILRKVLEDHGPNIFLKMAILFFNRRYFQSFTAIIVPERTSLYLRRMGVRTPRIIWTRHGAGDRAVGFAKDVKAFDFILLSGRKIEARLLAQGAIKPGHYYRGSYAKFDIVRRLRERDVPVFNNGRPTVLYNPHFSPRLSSWYTFGRDILEFFAHQDQFNLIFAPHYRLFDRHRLEGKRLVSTYANYDHILIDPGSIRSIEMTYTAAADLYLGDVSSQVAEFLIRPRPCLFLNAHHVEWRDNPNYQFWHLGGVIETLENFDDDLIKAFETHDSFQKVQQTYIKETFELSGDEPTAPGAADAIVEYLQHAA